MEKLTEDQAADLLSLVQSNASTETKVNEISKAKSAVKRNNVPDACVPQLFEMARITIVSSQAALVHAGFSTLNHLLTRLTTQEPKHIERQAKHTLPLVMDKMGDPKERNRDMATQCLTTFWRAASPEVERFVKNQGLVGKNSRAKETSMHWIVQMRNDYGLQFKTFVPSLVELLEDADGMVRDVARNTVIELFKDATGPAKSDLKRQIKLVNVRKTIVDAIMSGLGAGGHAEAEYPEESMPPPPSRNERPILGKSLTTPQLAERPVTPLPERSEHVEPLIMDTQRELEDTFKEMYPFFEGKESEQNWLKREQSCTKIRRLNAGNSPSEFTEMWVASIKGLLDGILKAVNSLRTSLSKEGCALLQEVAKTTKSGLDGMVEILLQNLVKLCGGTKKIASAAGDATIDIIISNVSYNKRILEHIYLACQDKNVQPRTYAAGWLRTLLKKEAHHKNHVEHSGGVDLIEKCIKKGLADANPGVREKMRGTFWIFAGMWPARSDALQATLDGVQLKLLQNDPNNPNSPKKAEAAVRPGLGFSKSTTGPAKPSLRETMLAQKKAAAAAQRSQTTTLPVRPGSAMSSFQSPMKSSGSTNSISSHASSSTIRSRPEGTTSVTHGGLSVAPMRPAKRPNAPPRPATAGPYDARPKPNAIPQSTTTASLATPSGAVSRIKPRTPANFTTNATKTSPKRAFAAPFPRPNTAQSSHASQSSSTSPSREKPLFAPRESRVESPHPSPPRTLPQPSPKWHPHQSPRLNPYNSPILTSPQGSKIKAPTNFRMSSPTARSPTRNDEDFTMVIPNLSKLSNDPPQLATSPVIKEARQSASDKMQIFEDPFLATAPKLDGPAERPASKSPVLEEVELNGDSHTARKVSESTEVEAKKPSELSAQKIKQNQTMLDSGIKRINAQSLGVHEFRGLQKLIKNSDHTLWSEGRFDTLLVALYNHMEAPLKELAPEKAQDVKAQLLATIKIMLKKNRQAVVAHASKGIDSLLVARAQHEARAHIVPGYELLAKELIQIGDLSIIADTIITRLQAQEQTHEANRTLTMGLQTLSKMMDNASFEPTNRQVEQMGILGAKCIGSKDSGVRKSAMEFCCMSLHSRIGDDAFWRLMNGCDEDLKKLMTYYLKMKTTRQYA